MNTNDEIQKIHDALVDKVAQRCVIDGTRFEAVAVGNDVITYGKSWTDAYANDGKVDVAESGTIKKGFAKFLAKRVKNVTVGKFKTFLYDHFLKPWIQKHLGIEY